MIESIKNIEGEIERLEALRAPLRKEIEELQQKTVLVAADNTNIIIKLRDIQNQVTEINNKLILLRSTLDKLQRDVQ